MMGLLFVDWMKKIIDFFLGIELASLALTIFSCCDVHFSWKVGCMTRPTATLTRQIANSKFDPTNDHPMPVLPDALSLLLCLVTLGRMTAQGKVQDFVSLTIGQTSNQNMKPIVCDGWVYC